MLMICAIVCRRLALRYRRLARAFYADLRGAPRVFRKPESGGREPEMRAKHLNGFFAAHKMGASSTIKFNAG